MDRVLYTAEAAVEVNQVAETLRAGGIDATAMHQHHLAEQPKTFYMHFWANGDPAALASGFRVALDHTNSSTALAPVVAIGH